MHETESRTVETARRFENNSNHQAASYHTLDGNVTNHSTSRVDSHESELILRFQLAERLIHWSIAIPFLVLFASGWILKLFYNVGDSELTSRMTLAWIHRIAGCFYIGLPMLSYFTHRESFKLHFDNIKVAWGWTKEDLKWLTMMGIAAINKKIKLPDQHKFNAAEKLNFMMVMTNYPIFIFTGLFLWIFGNHFTTWLVHLLLAIIATPLVLGHMYMALINPETRVGLSGMISGYVNREWAKHHYATWYRENFPK